MDLLRDLGEMALATRLRALSDRLMQEASALYAELDFPFEPRYFGVVQALLRQAPLDITQIARQLGLTHPAVRTTADLLMARGLIEEVPDPRDERRRPLRLTRHGRRLARELDPVWDAFGQASAEALSDAGVDLMADLTRVEDACRARPIADRVRARLGLPGAASVRIEDYRPAYKKHFRRLNEAWLREHFRIESADARILGDPNRHILKRGGTILFAVRRGQVVGTCALIPRREETVELTKMAVDESARGQGIGAALLDAALARAAGGGARAIVLQTHPKLKAAGRLYRRAGFRRVRKPPLAGSEYLRGGIFLRRALARPAAAPGPAPVRTAP